MIGYIYKWENKVNGKVYIGQTMNRYGYKERWSQHRYQAENGVYSNHFHNAIRKYGTDSFNKKVLKTIEMEDNIELKNALDRLEIEYIEKYDSFNNGYNSTLGGEFNVWNSSTDYDRSKVINKLNNAREKSDAWNEWINKHSKEVVKINVNDYSLIDKYKSCIDAAKNNGMDQSKTIRGRCRGEVCVGSRRRKSELFDSDITFMYLDDYAEGLTIEQVSRKYGNSESVEEVSLGLIYELNEDICLENFINTNSVIEEVDYSDFNIVKELLCYTGCSECVSELNIDISNFKKYTYLSNNEKIVISLIDDGFDKFYINKYLVENNIMNNKNVSSMWHRLNKKLYKFLNESA